MPKGQILKQAYISIRL